MHYPTEMRNKPIRGQNIWGIVMKGTMIDIVPHIAFTFLLSLNLCTDARRGPFYR